MLDLLLTDARIATMDGEREGPYGAIVDGAIGMRGGRIAFVGPAEAAPREWRETRSLGRRWVTPALIDCHTHLVFGGDRAGEFERRLRGASYEEIAEGGGGILSTVRATRAAPLPDLVARAAARLALLRRGGVATVEIKSGYGLTLEEERKMLVAAGEAAQALGLRVRRSLLALHAVPPEFKDNRAAYVRAVCDEVIPDIARRGLAEAVDAFCDKIAFTRAEVRAVFEAARRAGLAVKLHAEQLSNQNGAALAAMFGAQSADHLEHVDEAGVRALAKAGTVAVLLPGAYYAMKETRTPPIELFRKHGVAMAVATDLNPGSSPVLSPTLMMNMAATLFGLTPAEALAGMTRHAAKALGLADEIGVIREGLAADLAVWPIDHPAELAYWIAHPGPDMLIIAGDAVEP